MRTPCGAATPSRFLPWLLALLAVVAPACDDPDGPEPPATAPAGKVSFSFAGVRSGSFTVDGGLTRTQAGEPVYGSWAAAGQSGDTLLVAAFRGDKEPRGTAIVLLMRGALAPGDHPLSALCTAAPCGQGVLMFDVNLGDVFRQQPPSLESFYVITSGTARITAVSGGRLRGSFNGTAESFVGGAAGEILITGGSFDVPLLSDF